MLREEVVVVRSVRNGVGSSQRDDSPDEELNVQRPVLVADVLVHLGKEVLPRADGRVGGGAAQNATSSSFAHFTAIHRSLFGYSQSTLLVLQKEAQVEVGGHAKGHHTAAFVYGSAAEWGGH